MTFAFACDKQQPLRGGLYAAHAGAAAAGGCARRRRGARAASRVPALSHALGAPIPADGLVTPLIRTLKRSARRPWSRALPPCISGPNTSPPAPSGPGYSARVALSCERGHAPGQVLHALQELRQVIDERLRDDLGGRYDRHSAQSVGTDKLTVTFTLRAASHADAIRSAGLAAGTLAELLTHHAAAVDLSGVALVVRAQ